MSKNANYMSDDWAEIFENRVRSSGVWCDVSVKSKYTHFFVCRNEKATVAISRCGQIISTFDRLHENHISQKCLICSLYETSGKEVREINSVRLDTVIECVVQTQTQTKE